MYTYPYPQIPVLDGNDGLKELYEEGTKAFLDEFSEFRKKVAKPKNIMSEMTSRIGDHILTAFFIALFLFVLQNAAGFFSFVWKTVAHA